MDPVETEREKLIKEFMTHAGMTRQQAEFAASIELGEISGDLQIVDSSKESGSGTGQ